ncbi:energy transducer TonB [Zhongshania sp.]|uniref:energy transducer TonB n=1 Tax=Zhongshania sp. TaxID=1971902 RepID=UPI003569DD5C
MMDAVASPRKTGFGQSAESVIAISLLGVCAAAGLAAFLSSGGEQSSTRTSASEAATFELSAAQNGEALQSEEQAVLAEWQRRLDGEFSQHEQSKLQQQQLATLQEQSAALAIAQAAAEAAARAAEAAEARAKNAEKERQKAIASVRERSTPVPSSVLPDVKAPAKPEAKPVVASRRPAAIDWDSCARPQYPDESVRLGQQGTVTMEFSLDALGAVQDGRIVESSGTRRLDYRALSALSKCQFEPELVNGKAVESLTQLRFTWKLTR